jgi:hypothetical protein
VPIVGKSLGDAARGFKEHLNWLLPRTITQTHVTTFGTPGAPVMDVGFRQNGEPVAAPLATLFGTLDFSLLQICISEEFEDGKYRLHTAEYRYALTPRGELEPSIRWEYLRERPDPDARWARHHIQGTFVVGLESDGVVANDLHIPTGFVTIEEVIRFCIADLQVRPLSDEWNENLDESYTRFKTDFALPDLTDDSAF